jgi:hypothetical protein
MSYPISKLWHRPRKDLNQIIDARLGKGLEKHGGKKTIPVFFRADDVALPGRQFRDLIQVFSRHQVPLSMAVVPTWLTQVRWTVIKKLCQANSELWCFYQHGWRHKNHEKEGKKQEFGPARTRLDIENDLIRGRYRLMSLMGSWFYPAFTPPWNRLTRQTMEVLLELGTRVISRSQGASPSVLAGMKDFQVNVDLHTRKETSAKLARENLGTELTHAVAKGFCGIMIHHQRMNAHALVFLDSLLEQMRAMDRFRFFTLKELGEK